MELFHFTRDGKTHFMLTCFSTGERNSFCFLSIVSTVITLTFSFRLPSLHGDPPKLRGGASFFSSFRRRQTRLSAVHREAIGEEERKQRATPRLWSGVHTPACRNRCSLWKMKRNYEMKLHCSQIKKIQQDMLPPASEPPPRPPRVLRIKARPLLPLFGVHAHMNP